MREQREARRKSACNGAPSFLQKASQPIHFPAACGSILRYADRPEKVTKVMACYATTFASNYFFSGHSRIPDCPV
jgi:hypothetical protein